MKQPRIVFRVAAVMMLAASVASCGGEDGQSKALQPVATQAALSPEERVADDAVFPMDREEFRDTYAKLGAAQFKRANDLAYWAAVAAAEHGGICDRAAMVNVSDRSTREQIVWFVDCDNKQRVFVEQQQAEDAKQRFGNATSEVEQG